jgi:hypothetical protein
MGMTKKQVNLLAELFMGQFPDPYHNPRIDKAISLYTLAQSVKDGVILELGTYHGCGSIALAWGAMKGATVDTIPIPVITCDDYTPKRGWIGEPYGPEDKAIFFHNVAKARVKVSLMEMDESALLAQWAKMQKPFIGLLFWDLGGGRLVSDFERWSPLVMPGGVFAIHDTGDRKFGTSKVIGYAEQHGWTYEVEMAGFIYVLRRNE